MPAGSRISALNPLFSDVFLPLYQFCVKQSPATVRDFFINWPSYYKYWWMTLYEEAPHHIFIETALICFIIWLIFIRRTVDPNKSSNREKLSKKEVDWLVETWQPEPLVPPLNATQKALSDSMVLIDAVDGNYMIVRGVPTEVLNLSSFDFLGFSQDETVRVAARSALEKYGCGSCGPRGFYGTIDQHLKIEEAMALFMGTEEAISYSDGAATVSSTIPAFVKKGDLVLCDEACCEPIRMGLKLSRGTVQYFKHNDMEDLESLMQQVADDDIKSRKRNAEGMQRRFVVVEGLYRNTGDLCPLPEIVALKERFCYRLVLDESLSFGTMGGTGRGVTEHYGLNIKCVEIITVAMDTALASVGGLCVGTREVVDHQRLSGAGYCFSASAPPFLSACACAALTKLEHNPKILQTLMKNAHALHKGLSAIPGVALLSMEATPVMHIVLDPAPTSYDEEAAVIMEIARNCVIRGVGITASKSTLADDSLAEDMAVRTGKGRRDTYMSENGTGNKHDLGPIYVQPSLRICARATLTTKEIQFAISEIKKEVALVLTRFQQNGIRSSSSSSKSPSSRARASSSASNRSKSPKSTRKVNK